MDPGTHVVYSLFTCKNARLKDENSMSRQVTPRLRTDVGYIQGPTRGQYGHTSCSSRFEAAGVLFIVVVVKRLLGFMTYIYLRAARIPMCGKYMYA